ncbi:hypothetical protein AVEN_139332-1 [Araneus ventricosus]|uniref:Uncharacterized protein n=1 Tax=Araneus ventricosus TaxID=182803 RepID=A0A4Y2FXR0_ARAVE|nr:hypothetical protein AVEN_139332-1 [Araneus ventricosus]
MKIGVDRGRGWNSNIVGFPFIPFGHKSEIRFFEAGDKPPVCGGGGKCVGVRLEKSGRGREGAISKKRISPVWGRGSKQELVRFGTFMNNPPMDRLEGVENRPFVGPNRVEQPYGECPA